MRFHIVNGLKVTAASIEFCERTRLSGPYVCAAVVYHRVKYRNVMLVPHVGVMQDACVAACICNVVFQVSTPRTWASTL